MSWDIVLFNSKQKINLVAELDETQLERTDFTSILETAFKRINKNGNHREIVENDFTVEFFTDSQASSNLLLSIYGKSGLYALTELAKKHEWQIYDSTIDGMVDLENPKQNRFQDHSK